MLWSSLTYRGADYICRREEDLTYLHRRCSSIKEVVIVIEEKSSSGLVVNMKVVVVVVEVEVVVVVIIIILRIYLTIN